MAIRKENQKAYLLNIAKKCESELSSLGIPYAAGIEYSVNRRAKSRWGQCRMNRKTGQYSININEELIEPSVVKGLKETIIHEILHTCPECMNHGNVWKGHAHRVYMEYGYNIKRTDSAEDKGFSEEQIQQMKESKTSAKYVFRCKDCGQIISRERASKFTKHPEWYKCGKCGGKFEHVK